MDRTSFINSTVKTISALDSEMRIAIAQCLLVELEAKKDITRWSFWDRFSVKEHGSEMTEAKLSEEQVDQIMVNLNTQWNDTNASIRDTEEFTDDLASAVAQMVDSKKTLDK